MTEHEEAIAAVNAAPPAAPARDDGSNAVSLEEVRHVAALASLHLSVEEEPRMQRDLNAILGYVATLRALDTTGVPPMAQVGALLGEAAASHPPAAAHGSDLRADVPRESVDRAAVLREAPETDGFFFKVPKVIER